MQDRESRRISVKGLNPENLDAISNILNQIYRNIGIPYSSEDEGRDSIQLYSPNEPKIISDLSRYSRVTLQELIEDNLRESVQSYEPRAVEPSQPEFVPESNLFRSIADRTIQQKDFSVKTSPIQKEYFREPFDYLKGEKAHPDNTNVPIVESSPPAVRDVFRKTNLFGRALKDLPVDIRRNRESSNFIRQFYETQAAFTNMIGIDNTIQLHNLESIEKTGDYSKVKIMYGGEDLTDFFEYLSGDDKVKNDFIQLEYFKNRYDGFWDQVSGFAGHITATTPLIAAATVGGYVTGKVGAIIGLPTILADIAGGTVALNIFSSPDYSKTDDPAPLILKNSILGAIMGGFGGVMNRTVFRFFKGMDFVKNYPALAHFGLSTPTSFATGYGISAAEGGSAEDNLMSGIFLSMFHLTNPFALARLSPRGDLYIGGNRYYEYRPENKELVEVADLKTFRVRGDIEYGKVMSNVTPDKIAALGLEPLSKKSHPDYIKLFDGFRPIKQIKAISKAREYVKDKFGEEWINKNLDSYKAISDQLGRMSVYDEAKKEYHKFNAETFAEYDKRTMELADKHNIRLNAAKHLVSDPQLLNWIIPKLREEMGWTREQTKSLSDDILKSYYNLKEIPTLEQIKDRNFALSKDKEGNWKINVVSDKEGLFANIKYQNLYKEDLETAYIDKHNFLLSKQQQLQKLESHIAGVEESISRNNLNPLGKRMLESELRFRLTNEELPEAERANLMGQLESLNMTLEDLNYMRSQKSRLLKEIDGLAGEMISLERKIGIRDDNIIIGIEQLDKDGFIKDRLPVRQEPIDRTEKFEKKEVEPKILGEQEIVQGISPKITEIRAETTPGEEILPKTIFDMAKQGKLHHGLPIVFGDVPYFSTEIEPKIFENLSRKFYPDKGRHYRPTEVNNLFYTSYLKELDKVWGDKWHKDLSLSDKAMIMDYITKLGNNVVTELKKINPRASTLKVIEPEDRPIFTKGEKIKVRFSNKGEPVEVEVFNDPGGVKTNIQYIPPEGKAIRSLSNFDMVVPKEKSKEEIIPILSKGNVEEIIEKPPVEEVKSIGVVKEKKLGKIVDFIEVSDRNFKGRSEELGRLEEGDKIIVDLNNDLLSKDFYNVMVHADIKFAGETKTVGGGAEGSFSIKTPDLGGKRVVIFKIKDKKYWIPENYKVRDELIKEPSKVFAKPIKDIIGEKVANTHKDIINTYFVDNLNSLSTVVERVRTLLSGDREVPIIGVRDERIVAQRWDKNSLESLSFIGEEVDFGPANPANLKSVLNKLNTIYKVTNTVIPNIKPIISMVNEGNRTNIINQLSGNNDNVRSVLSNSSNSLLSILYTNKISPEYLSKKYDLSFLKLAVNKLNNITPGNTISLEDWNNLKSMVFKEMPELLETRSYKNNGSLIGKVQSYNDDKVLIYVLYDILAKDNPTMSMDYIINKLPINQLDNLGFNKGRISPNIFQFFGGRLGGEKFHANELYLSVYNKLIRDNIDIIRGDTKTEIPKIFRGRVNEESAKTYLAEITSIEEGFPQVIEGFSIKKMRESIDITPAKASRLVKGIREDIESTLERKPNENDIEYFHRISNAYNKRFHPDGTPKIEIFRESETRLIDLLGADKVAKLLSGEFGFLTPKEMSNIKLNSKTQEDLNNLNLYYTWYKMSLEPRIATEFKNYMKNLYKDQEKWKSVIDSIELMNSVPASEGKFPLAPVFLSAWIKTLDNAGINGILSVTPTTQNQSYAEFKKVGSKYFLDAFISTRSKDPLKPLSDFLEETTHFPVRTLLDTYSKKLFGNLYNEFIKSNKIPVGADGERLYAFKDAEEFITALTMQHILGDTYTGSKFKTTFIDMYRDFISKAESPEIADMQLSIIKTKMEDYLSSAFVNMRDAIGNFIKTSTESYELGKLSESKELKKLYEDASRYVGKSIDNIISKKFSSDDLINNDNRPYYERLSTDAKEMLIKSVELDSKNKHVVWELLKEDYQRKNKEYAELLGLKPEEISQFLRDMDDKLVNNPGIVGIVHSKAIKDLDKNATYFLDNASKFHNWYEDSIPHKVFRNLAKHNWNVLSIGEKYGGKVEELSNEFSELKSLRTRDLSTFIKIYTEKNLMIDDAISNLSKENKEIFTDYFMYVTMLNNKLTFEPSAKIGNIDINSLEGIEYRGSLGQKVRLRPLNPEVKDVLRRRIDLDREMVELNIEAEAIRAGKLSNLEDPNPELWKSVIGKSIIWYSGAGKSGAGIDLPPEKLSMMNIFRSQIYDPVVPTSMGLMKISEALRALEIKKSTLPNIRIPGADADINAEINKLNDIKRKIKSSPYEGIKYLENQSGMHVTLNDFLGMVNDYQIDYKVAKWDSKVAYDKFPQYFSRVRLPNKYYAVISKVETVDGEGPIKTTAFHETYSSQRKAVEAINLYLENRGWRADDKNLDIFTGNYRSVAERLGLQEGETLAKFRLYDQSLLENLLHHAGGDKKKYPVLYENLQKILAEKGRQKRRLHTNFIDGYDPVNIPLSINKFTKEVASNYVSAIYDASIHKVVKEWESLVPKNNNWENHYLRFYLEHENALGRTDENKFLKGARLFAAFMGLTRPVTSLINPTQPVNRGLSVLSMVSGGKGNPFVYLGQGYNYGKKFTLVNKGMKDIKTLTDKENHIYKNVYIKALQSGELDQMISTELASKESGIEAQYAHKGYLMKGLFIGQRLGEAINRRCGFNAGASLGYDRGLRGDKLYAFASRVNMLINDGVGPMNIPFFVTGISGRRPTTQSFLRTLAMFTQYPIGFTQGMVQALKQIPKGRLSPALLAMLPTIAMAGLWGLPGIGDTKNVLKDGFDVDIDLAGKELMKEIAGMPDWAIDVAFGGVPYFLGADLRRSAGIGDFASRYANTLIDIFNDRADVTSPFPGLELPIQAVTNTIKAAKEYAEHGSTTDFFNYVQKMSPGLFTGGIKYLNYKENGVRDRNGNILIDKSQIKDGESLLLLLGITPTTISKIKEVEFAKDKYQSSIRDDREKFAKDLEYAIRRKDDNEFEKILDRVIEYNESKPVVDQINIRGLITTARNNAYDVTSRREMKKYLSPEFERLKNIYNTPDYYPYNYEEYDRY